MEPIVRELADRLAIMELGARYNRAALSWDAVAFADCFTPDGRLVRAHEASEVQGRDALISLMRRGAETGRPGSYHLTTDLIVELGEDRATGTCQVLIYGHDLSQDAETGNVLRGVGHFEDTVVRTPDGWRYEERYAWVTAPDALPIPIGRGRLTRP